MKYSLINYKIIIIALLISLYSFETYLNINLVNFNQYQKIKAYEKKTNKKYDKREKITIYKELKIKNSNISLTVPPSNYTEYPNKNLYPLSGRSNSKTIICNENGYYSIIESDRYGFNNPDKEWNQNEIEYFLTGDSFTFGSCLNRPHDLGSVLRNLSGKSVLNLGHEGNGPLIEYAVLREYLNTNVKNVLWIYYEDNDLYDLQLSLKSKLLNNYLLDKNFKQNLKERQNEINKLNNDRVEETINHIESRYKRNTILRFIRLDKTKKIFQKILSPPKKKKFNNDVFIRFKKILNFAKKLTEDNGANFYFIYLPSYLGTTEENLDKDMNQRSEVLSTVNELDIDLIDIKKIILEKKINYQELFACETCHYTIEGYNLIAHMIYKKILQNEFSKN